MVVKRSQTYVSGVGELVEIAKIREPDFNLSHFVRNMLEIYIFGYDPLESRRMEVFAEAGHKYLNERLEERKMTEWISSEISKQVEERKEIELSKKLEEHKIREAREQTARIVSAALEATFSNISSWKYKLPEDDPFGDFSDSWIDAALKISEQTGIEVAPSECYAYVRTRQER